MDDESDYPTFVKVAEKESSSDDYMELPREKDGTVLLSTIQAQFTNAIGLKYKSSSGAWRGIRAEDNVLEAPHGGWGETVYIVTQGDSSRKKSEESGRPKKKNKFLGDLIVFGLPVSVKNEDLKEYFEETCGEMEFAEIKHDRFTKKSRGFGFVRFKTEEGAREAMSGNHEIEGRKLVVKFSEKRTNPLQLFVGRVPRSATTAEVKEYFSDFGDLDDCFVPSGRGFAFVTFSSDEEGKGCLRASHTFKGASLKVTVAEPRDGADHRGHSAPRGRGSATRGRGPPPSRGAERYSMPTYGSWKSPSTTERVRDRSNERYDKYANDRHIEPRGRTNDRYGERHASGSYEQRPTDRRRGAGREVAPQAPAAAAGKDIASELKNMLFTLLKNHQK